MDRAAAFRAGDGFLVVRLVIVVVPIFVVVFGVVVGHGTFPRPAVAALWQVGNECAIVGQGGNVRYSTGKTEAETNIRAIIGRWALGPGFIAIAALLAASIVGRGHLGRGQSSALVWSDPGRSVFGERFR